MFHSREYLTKPDTKHISTEPCGPKKTVTSYLLLWWNSLAWLTITIKYWNEDAWSCMKKERERTNRKSCRRWCLVRHSSRLDSGEIIELRSGTSRTVELTYSWIWAKRIWGNCTCFSFAKKQKQTNKNLLKLGKSKEKKKQGVRDQWLLRCQIWHQENGWKRSCHTSNLTLTNTSIILGIKFTLLTMTCITLYSLFHSSFSGPQFLPLFPLLALL